MFIIISTCLEKNTKKNLTGVITSLDLYFFLPHATNIVEGLQIENNFKSRVAYNGARTVYAYLAHELFRRIHVPKSGLYRVPHIEMNDSKRL